MKYSHFFLGEREQRIIFFEAPKPAAAEVKAEPVKPAETSVSAAEGQKRVADATGKADSLTKSLEGAAKLGAPDIARDPVGPLSNETLALHDKAEAARAKADEGKGTVRRDSGAEKGDEAAGNRPDWAAGLSDAELAHMNAMMKDLPQERKDSIDKAFRMMNPDLVKKMANGMIARQKLENTIGTELMSKIGTPLFQKMMVNGVPQGVTAKSLGITDAEFAKTKEAIAQFHKDLNSGGTESDKPDPDIEKRRGELQTELSQAKTNGERIQAQMKLAQLEISDPNNKNKLVAIISLVVLAYQLVQSIKDGSYDKVNIEATAAGSGEKAADIIAKSKNPEEARPKLVARREMNLQGMKQMDSENQANAKELAKLNKEIADKTRENGATPPPAEATKSINNQVIAANQERAKVIQEAMDANNETKKVMQEENKVIDAYVAGSPADKSSPDTKGAGEKPEAPPAGTDVKAPESSAPNPEKPAGEPEVKPAAAPTVAPDMKPLTPAEVLNNSRTVDRAKEQVLSSFAAIKNAEPDFVNSLQGQISMKVDDSTGKINVSIQESALFAMNAMQQKYELPINPLAKKMEDPKPVVAVLQKIQKAINDKNEGAASTAPVYN